MSHHTGRAREISSLIAEAHPNDYETWYYFNTRVFKTQFLDAIKAEIKESGGSLPEDHSTSPFVWLETSSDPTKKEMTGLGGRDKLCEWAQAKFDAQDRKNSKFLSLCEAEPPKTMKTVFFDNATPGTANTSA